MAVAHIIASQEYIIFLADISVVKLIFGDSYSFRDILYNQSFQNFLDNYQAIGISHLRYFIDGL
jgi:hypothetical protein